MVQVRCEVFDATKTYCTATETVEARLGAASASAAAAVLGLATEHTARGGEQCCDLGSAEADPLAEVRIARYGASVCCLRLLSASL